MNTRYRAVLILLFTIVLWSTSGVFVKLSSWDAIPLNGARSAIAALVIWLYLRQPNFTWSRSQLGGAMMYAVMLVTFVQAVQMTTAANAVFLQYTSPLFVLLFSFILFREKPQPIDWFSIAAIMSGMLLFFGDELTSDGLTGNLLAIGSGVCMACMILALRQQKDGSPAETILLGNLFAALIAIPFIGQQTPTPTDIGIILFLGIFQLGLPFILYAIVIKELTAIELALIQTFEPILNPIWVFLIVGEIPGSLAIIGGGVVLAAVLVRSVWVGRKIKTA